uniref:HNH endonuclease signature motif containing protein n=1 Tax=Nitrospira cf. moscoviensis SBR1015 TaxID=96242 RepID=UPI000B3BAFE1|nr:HNH endonuclease signature motif containing protein [Nitrospira cf. moscoviensis SBR1015]
MTDSRPIKERFESFIMPVTECGCWLWTGGSSTRGYGQFRMLGRGWRAHRAAWTIYRGPIPDGLHVLHKCDVTSCVNPDHLFLGTPLDNARDKESKGRGNQPRGLRNGRYTKPWATCRGDRHPARINPEIRQGEKNGRAKLTASDIIAIRTSPLGNRPLGRIYGVSHTNIRRIKIGKLWGHLS